MKVFVAGATGYLGSGLVRALRRAGHEVFGLARSREKADSLGVPGVHWILGDLRDPASYAESAAECDGIVNAAIEWSANVAEFSRRGLESLLAATRASGDPRVFVFTSGVWVLGATGETRVDEDAPAHRPYEIAAWRVAHERAALEASGGPIVTAVVRPGNVYGGGGGTFGGFFAQAAKDGAVTIVGDGSNRWATVHLEDTAELYLRILEGRAGGVFHAVDGTADTLGNIGRAAARAGGREGAVRLRPLAEARGQMGPLADALASSQVVGASHSERVLGWRPRWRGFVRNADELHAEWSRGR